LLLILAVVLPCRYAKHVNWDGDFLGFSEDLLAGPLECNGLASAV